MFLDNIDNYTKFGPTPEKKEALLDFLQVLNIVYPNIHLMQNAGVSIIKDTHPFINSVAKESIASDYNFQKGKYQLRDENVFTQLLNELKEVYDKYEVSVVLIEYAETRKLKKDIKQRLAQTPWPFFIGKIDLQSIPEKG